MKVTWIHLICCEVKSKWIVFLEIFQFFDELIVVNFCRERFIIDYD